MAKVLIVHDDPLMQEITSLALEIRGHAVTCAQDAEEALSKTQANPFDLVVLDSPFDEANLSEICARVRTHGAEGQVVISARAVDGPGSRVPPPLAGVHVVLLTPMRPPELHETIIQLAERVSQASDVAEPDLLIPRP